MDLDGKRILVAGATGALGGRLARALKARNATIAPAGRDRAALLSIAEELNAEPIELELTDPVSCARAVESAGEALGGLDGLVIATGVVAFGRSGELDPRTERTLLEVNAAGPITLIGAALPRLAPGGGVVALSAVVAEFPTAGMAAYSASKAALSAYLEAIRRERRRDLDLVLDVRPGHLETGFAERALAGEPPKLPAPGDTEDLVERILDAIEAGARTLSYDPRTRELSQT